ncbi:MAG: primosomal protein N' [Anaerolineae bacterium]|nr:primosomal protein N' [Anaerolineae bacterium]
MFAEIVVNVEAPLEGTFHYHVPVDMRRRLVVGHLVEIEFGRNLAQGIIIAFDSEAPVEETKPVITLIDPVPVVRQWQIELAQWISEMYRAPLNNCLRLMLPPGLTRWSDMTLAINPYWGGEGRLTDAQMVLVALLREHGDLRGRQIKRHWPKKLGKKKWRTAALQLVKRDILVRGTVLDAPRNRPKKIRTAELITDPERIRAEVVQLGRANKQADVLDYLATSADPLPSEAELLAATGATTKHLAKLEADGLIHRFAGETVSVETDGEVLEVVQPAAVGLAIRPKETLGHILRLRGAQKYNTVLHHLATAAQPVPVTDIYAETGATITHLRKLAKLDLIRLGDEAVWRDSLADRDFVPVDPPLLTHDQARVWGRIKSDMLDDESVSRPILLHGVTGSGKTEIYMRAVDFALAQGQAAIVLVPEIALTPQTVRRFAARFPGRVALIHSRLSEGERYDTWRRARRGLFDIIIGPRSALFTPLDNVGVIIIDEEHDASYKQTPPVPPPYYHTRETAIAFGRIVNATVIMGSATPDVVTYHRARSDTYRLLELPRRVMGHRTRLTEQAERIGRNLTYQAQEGDPDDAVTIPLPPVELVDLRQELRAGNRSIFSRRLQTAIDETLARREQAILFLNRRGTASFVICRDCGHTLHCPRCDTPLTYHRPNLALTCHYCGHREQQHSECPNCGSHRIRYFGLGTEELETLVQQRWPEARTVRWDRDTTAGRDTHEQLLASFINHEADILVGTQMIAKGLDLPLVTTVGVISADVALGLPDYRTGERAFQVLTQVAGRAGRGVLGGSVVLQTYQPEHYAIQSAADHDYTQFYIDEIRFRTQHGLPPFRRLAKLVISDPNPNKAEEEAAELANQLRWQAYELRMDATEIIGPVPPFFGRIDRRYRRQILIRSTDPARLLAEMTIPPRWIVDIDPVSTL